MRLIPALLIVIASIALAANPSSGSAGVILEPTKFTDSADGTCDSDCSLREAVIQAATSGGTTTIRLEAGRYDLTLGIGDGRETDPAWGDLDLAGELVVEGAGARQTSISANGMFTVLHVLPEADVLITDLTVAQGFGYAGAGLYNEGTVTLEDCIISDNNSDGLTGGGITNHGHMLIQRCLIVGNTTGSEGGAGGGIASRDGSLTIVSSTIAQNTSAFAGGGIMRDGGERVRLTNVTITENQAGLAASSSGGGGLYGQSEMSNTVISGNTADFAPDCVGPVSLGHNLIKDVTDCNFTPDPTDLTGVDPRLGPLTATGDTLAYFPQAASPLIDAGANATCPLTDQRGHPRPRGASCDIGAIEIGGPFRLWGDVDCDGEISTRDNQAELRFVLQQNPLSQTEPCPNIGAEAEIDGTSRTWGDEDCDGEVTTRDNQAKLRHVLQQAALSQEEPCPDIGSAVQVVVPQ